MTFTDGSWAVFDADGRFDAANDGKIDHLQWLAGKEALRLSQFRDHCYDPGLLGKHFGSHSKPLRAAPGFSQEEK